MTTEAKFKYALKEMMLSKTLDEINVTSLCKKCGCHRQTFYYHYQDIYDLLAAIFLSEAVPGLTEATTPKAVLSCLLAYSKENLAFLRSSYGSAAHELVDDFFYNKIMTKMFSLLSADARSGLDKNACRDVARRYANVVGDEFGYCFKDIHVTVARFEKSMNAFISSSLTTVLPALIQLSKEEKE